MNDHRDSMFHEAAKQVQENMPKSRHDLLKPPWRGNWVSLPKPWYWVFTFWKTEWKNYGTFEEEKFGTPGYESATYEIAHVCKRETPYQLTTGDNHAGSP